MFIEQWLPKANVSGPVDDRLPDLFLGENGNDWCTRESFSRFLKRRSPAFHEIFDTVVLWIKYKEQDSQVVIVKNVFENISSKMIQSSVFGSLQTAITRKLQNIFENFFQYDYLTILSFCSTHQTVWSKIWWNARECIFMVCWNKQVLLNQPIMSRVFFQCSGKSTC